MGDNGFFDGYGPDDFGYEEPQDASTFKAIVSYFDSKEKLTDLTNILKREFPDKEYQIMEQNYGTNIIYTIHIEIVSIENFLTISFESFAGSRGKKKVEGEETALNLYEFGADPFEAILTKVRQSAPNLIIFDRGKLYSYSDYYSNYVQEGLKDLQYFIESIKGWTISPPYRLNDLKGKRGKTQRLLQLAKQREMTQEVEELQAAIELLREKEAQAQKAQLEDFLKQFEALDREFAEFLRRITPPLQSLSTFLKEIELYDYHFEEFFDYSMWKSKFDSLLQFAEQLILTDKLQMIKDRLSTLQNMKQQMDDINKQLDNATKEVEEFLRDYRKVSLERLKQKLHLADEDLENLLKMLITCDNIRAHIEGIYICRE